MTITDSDLIGFCEKVLTALGGTIDETHLVGPLAWCYAEGGWQHNDAAYNPWNTTQAMPGSLPTNSVGVQAYASESQGVEATVTTLKNGLYPSVIHSLLQGDANALASAVGASPWGTSAELISACISRAQAAIVTNGIPQEATPVSESEPEPELPFPPVSTSDPTSPVVACISRPNGGGWIIHENGAVDSLPGTPFYGSYQTLAPDQRQAPATFVGAVWGDGTGRDGYTLIHTSWDGKSDAGLYRFGDRPQLVSAPVTAPVATPATLVIPVAPA